MFIWEIRKHFSSLTLHVLVCTDVMEADVVVEDMDQTCPSAAPTSVIVNVTG